MSNTLIFDYAVGISEAQTATEVDYSFLKKCLVMVAGNYIKGEPKTAKAENAKAITKVKLKNVKKQVEVKNLKTGKSAIATREFTDPTQFKVAPIYDATDFAKYTDNTDVSFFMTGGLSKVYLLVLATEVDPADENVIDFDPTDYFTLCFSSDIDIADAQSVDFADFSGVKAYATADKALAETLAKSDTVFLDDNGCYAGCYEAFGRLLSQMYWRNCQYYVLDSDNPTTTIKTVSEGSDLFDKRISFFLNGSAGPTLGFFGNTGNAITTAYVKRLIRLQTQEAITSYIQVNQPNNTSVQRINIEEAAADVILQYEGYPYFYLDSDVDNYINIVKSDETYYVNGEAAVKDAEPIWRAKIEVSEAQ
ncbi:MAG: hypothetical protein ACK5MF_06355 [Vibrio sp.]|uniref:hypothetical protein n=1 Tax=Vibrio sp. TaxID=678 RepID=UPI003A83E768